MTLAAQCCGRWQGPIGPFEGSRLAALSTKVTLGTAEEESPEPSAGDDRRHTLKRCQPWAVACTALEELLSAEQHPKEKQSSQLLF